MADTPLLGNTYPDENQDPWWTTIRSYFLAKDEWSQVNYEDKSLLVYGGGTMTLIGSTFSWSAPLYIVSQRSVTKITIAASSLALADGEVLFVTTGVRPITNQTLVLQAGSPTTKNDIPIGYRSGATVHIKDLTFLSGYTLDDAYNASSGAASVSIDAGDVTWDTVGAYSLNVDLSATTGAVDGFFVEDGTDYFRFIHKGVNTLDIKSELRDFDVNASGTSTLNAVGTFTVDSDGAAIIGGASVTVEADGGILALTGDGAADIDMSNTGAGIDIDSATFLVDTTAGFSLDAVTASNITVSGATADLTLGARSTSITLNEVGQTSLNGGFAATSIIGAINENYASIAAGGSSTLDDAYNNDAGAAGITVDAGDVTWSPTGDYSFIVDLAATTNTSDGFSVVNGTDQFNLIRDAANQISVNVDCTTFSLDASAAISIDSVANSNVSTTSADLTISTITSGELDLTSAGLMDINAGANLDIDVTGNYTMDSTGTFSIDGVGVSNITNDTGNLTVSTTTSGSLILDAVALLDINAGANLDIDVTGTLAMDATSTIEWSGTNASLTSAGNLGVGTPATTDRVGIKSAGGTAIASLGSTLLTNGDFVTDLSSWTAGAGWSWSSGTALHTAGNTATLTQGVSVSNGAQYQFSVVVSGRTAGSVAVSFVGSPETLSLTSDNTYTVTFRAASTSTINLVFTPTTDFDGALDDVTFQLITPASTYDFALYDTTGARSGIVAIAGLASQYNSFLGEGSGRYNTTGFRNSAQGYRTLYFNTAGSYNSAQGYQSLYSNTTGSYNSGQGYYSLSLNTTGDGNSSQGVQSLYSNTTGTRNSAQGYLALSSNTTGANNSAQGYQSLYSNTTGTRNSAQGYQAGRYTSALAANETSTYCTFVGNGTRVNADGDTNETAIGNAAIGIGSNTVTLGNSAVTQTRLGGIISTINGGLSTGSIANALSMGHDSSGHTSWIQSEGTGATELLINPQGGLVSIGGATTGHSLSDGDLVCDKLETNGTFYADDGLIVSDDKSISLGDSEDFGIRYSTVQTPDSLLFGVSTQSRAAIFCEVGDFTYDFAHALQTNPTLFVQSANQSATEWISIAHNQTDGVIDCGTGTLNLGGTANVNFAGASVTTATVTHTAYVVLEIDGTEYKFMLGDLI